MTPTEENYLKTIFMIAEREKKAVSTNKIAFAMGTSAASVSDMLKKLANKKFIDYKKYHGVLLTETGNKLAIKQIRKHRLWEVFLTDKLKFKWNEIHEIAEQLEHIKSDELIRRLDILLGSPKFDPHGDPIPNAEGKFTIRTQIPLADLAVNQQGILISVRNNNDKFLSHLSKLKIKLGSEIKVVDIKSFDKSRKVVIDQQNEEFLSGEISQNLMIKKIY